MAGTSSDPQGGTISAINVTPLVDVMLVLLVIFMVTAPMLQSGVTVDLPQTSSAAPLRSGEAPLVVSVTREGALYLNDAAMDFETLRTKLVAIHKEKPTQIVYLRADHAASYGLVVGVIASLKAAGIEQLGMITEPGNAG
jgi:biopolymer transport protein TolR